MPFTITGKTDGVAGATYSWFRDDVEIPGADGASYASPGLPEGTYTFVRVASTVECDAPSNPVVVTVVAPPAAPAAPTQNGPKCAGTGVTFSASIPAGATGLDWTGSVSGTGTSKTTATTAGNYTAQVRAYYTASGITCYSGWSTAATGVVAACNEPGSTVTFTAFDPCTDAPVLSTWRLADLRESSNPQTYTVRLMHDGHYWMVQDLKFGDKCNKTTFAGSTSNQTGKITTLSGTWYGDCRNNTQSGAGYLYDWAGAIQQAGAYYSGSNVGCSGTGTAANACQGICPEGWHIPTGNTNGEYQALHTAIGGCSEYNDNCWDASSTWEGVYGGLCRNTGTLGYQGSYAYYWTCTRNSTVVAYCVSFDPTSIYPGTSTSSKHYGSSVRCVRNY
jgi:uncharacterized protein (TIGR02145 family)